MEEIETRYYSSLNSNIRLNTDLTSYAKLLCAELIALADNISITETDEEIASLMNLPESVFKESMDLLEGYHYISIVYDKGERIINLERIAL